MSSEESENDGSNINSSGIGIFGRFGVNSVHTTISIFAGISASLALYFLSSVADAGYSVDPKVIIPMFILAGGITGGMLGIISRPDDRSQGTMQSTP